MSVSGGGGTLGSQSGAANDQMIVQLNTEAYSRTPKMFTDDKLDTDLRTPGMSTGWTKKTENNTSSSGKNVSASTSTLSGTSTSVTHDVSREGSMACLDLLLLGKTGVGKSATGNSILGKKMFKSSSAFNSETDKICSSVSKVNGRIIKVVDGPGVGDTRMDTEDGISLFVESIEHAMITNPVGFHALLLVLRFGSRFTQEDEDTVTLLKRVFGSDFVQKYCVIVVTCGDMFKYEEEETGEDFHQWVSQQEGRMANLVAECQRRIVLFDNVTKNEAEMSAQVEQLIEAIGRLDNNGKRYTDTNFEAAMNAREKVIAESKVPITRDATLQAMALLMQDLSYVRDKGIESEDPAALATSIQELERLLKVSMALKEEVTAQDMGTGVLKDLMGNIETMEKSIQSSLSLHRELLESRRQQQESERELTSQMESLQQEMETTEAEEEKMKLMRENELLKLQLQQLMRDRREIEEIRERQKMMYSDLQYREQQFYAYQAQREGAIRKAMKSAYKLLKRGTSFVFSFFMDHRGII